MSEEVLKNERLETLCEDVSESIVSSVKDAIEQAASVAASEAVTQAVLEASRENESRFEGSSAYQAGSIDDALAMNSDLGTVHVIAHSPHDTVTIAAAAAAAASAAIAQIPMNDAEVAVAATAAIAHVPTNEVEVAAAATISIPQIPTNETAVEAAASGAIEQVPTSESEVAAAAAAATSAAIAEAPTGEVESAAVAAVAAVVPFSDMAVIAGNHADPTILSTDRMSIQPEDRDVVLGSCSTTIIRKANLILSDLIKFERFMWKLYHPEKKANDDDLELVATKLIERMKFGRPHQLAGLKDVPYPFMKYPGRFLSCDDNDTFFVMSDDCAKRFLIQHMMHDFNHDLGEESKGMYDSLMKDLNSLSNAHSSSQKEGMAETKDIILLICSDSNIKNLYEHHSGNKKFFNLACKFVTSDTNDADKRIAAAVTVMKGLNDFASQQLPDLDTSDTPDSSLSVTAPRFLIRIENSDESVVWEILDRFRSVAEFCLIFVFEVFLEKGFGSLQENAEKNFSSKADCVEPGTIPVHDPTHYDVLFGRGGMTNSHSGNRRFRDIIALHRPDYNRANKMDKPAVARKIVKAIRFGNPPGRFLKKRDSGHWYDVGDRTANEKTSQGLRERTNAEKRKRSALREALRTSSKKQDDVDDDKVASKQLKTEESPELSKVDFQLPPSLKDASSITSKLVSIPAESKVVKSSVKKKSDIKEEKPSTLESNVEIFPPNAVDTEGNIIVTDYDILCGRGGLTNHHIGNKRFRDIVALHRSDYVRAPKIQKPSVARTIVRAIRNGDPPGRFLKKDEKLGKWLDVGDKKAAEKTSQALREKTEEERDQVKIEGNTSIASATIESVANLPTLLGERQINAVSYPVVPSKGDAGGVLDNKNPVVYDGATNMKVENDVCLITDPAAKKETRREVATVMAPSLDKNTVGVTGNLTFDSTSTNPLNGVKVKEESLFDDKHASMSASV